MNIAIKDTVVADCDTRETEDQENFEGLVESIKQHGFLNPLTGVKVGNKYRIIAGRRRLAAAKKIGLKMVPVYVNAKIRNEKTIALLENVNRKDLNETEKGNGLVEVYKSEGFDNKDVIKALKSKHNMDQYLKKSNSDNDCLNKRDKSGHPLLENEKFMALFKSTGLSANYQYQLMQIVTQLAPEIQNLADKEGLSTGVKIWLTTRPLRDHPVIQKRVIKAVGKYDYGPEHSQKFIQQTALDLETGYLYRTDEGDYYYKGARGKGDKITDDNTVRPLELGLSDIQIGLNKVFHRVTGHKLNKGEHEYTEDMIKNTKMYRLEIIKAAVDERALTQFEKDLILNKIWTDEMLEMLSREFQTIEMKKGMIGK